MTDQMNPAETLKVLERPHSENAVEELHRKNYLANREILLSVLVSICSFIPSGAVGFLFCSTLFKNSYVDDSLFYWAGLNGFISSVSSYICWYLLKRFGLPTPVVSILTIFFSPWAPLWASGSFNGYGGDLSYALGIMFVSLPTVILPSLVSSGIVVLQKSGFARNNLKENPPLLSKE